jgi:7-keto-8-aminopelargonate synthetase-like enzyme
MATAIDLGIARVRVQDAVLDGEKIRLDGRELINFGTAAYLGLNTDPRLKQGAIDAIERFGPVFSSSTVYSSVDLYGELQTRLEQIFGTAVIIPTTTTLGHLGALPVLVGPKDVVVVDAQAHASVHLSTLVLMGEGIPVLTVPHNNMDALAETVAAESRRAHRVWYLADGVYSMYGDTLPVRRLNALLGEFENLYAYIDDAHGFGWKGEHGRGHVLAEMEIHPRLTVAVSLSKSFGSGGAAIAFYDESLARSVLLRGGTFTFSGPIHPAELGAAVASANIHLSGEHADRVSRLHEQVNLTRTLLTEYGLPIASRAQTPIWFVEIGGHKETFELVRRLKEDGYFVNASAHPAVPLNHSGIRIANALYHSDDHIRGLVTAIAENAEDLIDSTAIVVDLTDDAEVPSTPESPVRHAQ